MIFNGYSQRVLKDTSLIEWNSEKKISWNNFLGEANAESSFKAECVTFFRRSFYTKNDSVFCRIQTFFNQNESWKKNFFLDDGYDLNHEQIHFNITEFFARKLRQIISLNDLNEETIQKKYDEIAKDCDDFQKKYDEQTNHSINILKQNEWTKKLTDLLSSLSLFTEQSIYIKHPICRICWE